ncbi:polyketide cyclase [Streptomyces fumigatiscleroticus]|nr:polyketide cyclase [Streptomyces fumigatiscleroticus]
MTTTQNAIDWPEKYLPGTGDNFVSNEVIVRGLRADDVWPLLTDTSVWESYYDNVAGISFPDGDGPVLRDGVRFGFATFGFPPLDARVVEFAAPADGVPGRLSWTARQDGPPKERLDVLHAWLVEDLPGGRVRVLTQESQLGQPAAKLSRQTPNPMLNGHQAWLDGLVDAARRRVAG